MILSCVDSRIPVEDVFDRGIGDIFVARVAGSFENTDILGRIEFTTKLSGAKPILVLGHDQCGAVESTGPQRVPIDLWQGLALKLERCRAAIGGWAGK